MGVVEHRLVAPSAEAVTGQLLLSPLSLDALGNPLLAVAHAAGKGPLAHAFAGMTVWERNCDGGGSVGFGQLVQ